MRRKIAISVVVATAATLLAVPGTSGAAVGSGYVLDLEFNEPTGASTAVDASGLGHDGAIGSHVVRTVPTPTGTAIPPVKACPTV